VYELVNQQEQYFIGALGENKVEWAKESQFAMQVLGSNDFLAKTAMNAQASLQNAVINVAAIGISLNPALKHAYLVPRGGAVCLDISYIGLLHIAMQSGSIEWGQAKLVYANDEYQNNGIDKAPSHKQNTFGDKGLVVGAYCTVKTSTGAYLTEEMDIAALEKVAATSKASTGPWKQWREQMMRKTVLKRGSHYWPTVERLSQAIETLNAHEGLEEPVEKEVNNTYLNELVSQDQIERLKKAMASVNMSEDDFCKKVDIKTIGELHSGRYTGAINWILKAVAQ
tara:strand:- start:291 stop:1139 length:849 start_codon:yes stop_codon:yes gene_type:complete